MKTHYEWKRYLCPRDGMINLSDRGFLIDPESQYGAQLNPDVVDFPTIANKHGLVILGEPGIGKSSTLASEYERIGHLGQYNQGVYLKFDLRAYQTDMFLHQDVFGHPDLLAWKAGDHNLHLFLDSLDECLINIRTVASLLAQEFKRLPTDRLYLRIACRTATWPSTLESELLSLWPGNQVGVYELAPLRRVDVAVAAEAEGFAPQKFLSEVDRAGVASFAIKPITLRFLLSTMRQGRELAASKTDIYFEGCRMLCHETNQSRVDSGMAGALSTDRRLLVAGRIAVLTMIGNRFAVFQGAEPVEVPDADISIREICGGEELAAGLAFEITQAEVQETLGTGLFSSRGPNRMGWAHQTYAEFLTAWYLHERNVPLRQLKQLITHPEDPDGKLPPQLNETAAWLARYVPGIFAWLSRIEPEILLRGDVAAYSDEGKQDLVQSLLANPSTAMSISRDPITREAFRNLGHPQISEQLRTYLVDPTQADAVRIVAIDIGGACDLQSLQGVLVSLALDEEQPLRIRIRAASSIAREECADDLKAKLKPLAFEMSNNDPDDELKGLALTALWPKHISAQELFQILRPPKRSNLFGVYRAFLSMELAPGLSPSDLPVALRWVETSVREGWHELVEEAVNQILFLAWQHLEAPSVLQAFSRIALARLMSFDKIISGREEKLFTSDLVVNEDNRHLVAETMIKLISDPSKEAFWMVHGPSPVVFPADVPWMIHQLKEETSDKAKDIWSYLVMSALDRSNIEHVELAYYACETSPHLNAWLGSLFRPVRLDSPEAQSARERYVQARQIEDRRLEQLHSIQEAYDERVQQIDVLLRECEDDSPDAWWRLNLVLLSRRDEGYIREHDPNLTELAPWMDADLSTRARILEAGKRYLLCRDAEPSKWLGTNILYRPAYAGYRALRMIMDEDPEYLGTLPQHTWRGWAPIILAYPTYELKEIDAQEYLIKKAYPHAQQEIMDTLKRLIEKENEESEHLFVLRKLHRLRDVELHAGLLEILRSNELAPAATGDLLSFLLKRDVLEARDIAISALPSRIPSGDEPRRKCLAIAQALFCNTPDAGWDIIWPLVQRHEEFGKDLFLIVAERSDDSCPNPVNSLTEDEVADLVIWLETRFPREEDPNEEGAHVVSPREMLANWRDALLRALAGKGTYNACRQIQRIAEQLPQLSLEWLVQDALAQARRSTWVPPKPSEILELVSSPAHRLVRSGEELLEVLLESLRRLEQELQGETPAIPDLWNAFEGRHRPKDEPAFSDYVKRFLDRDLKQRGVVVNREVEIRRGEGEASGERTDIHVDAISTHPGDETYDRIKVIIETKGSWNSDLRRAMETQLVGRYLSDSDCRHGLYLVGWFNCQQWDEDDWRQARAPHWTLEQARDHFENQACELSRGILTIRSFVMNTSLR